MSNRLQLLQAFLRNDLNAFTRKAFSTLRPGDEYLPNWHIEAITYRLQQIAEGKIRRLIITMPPRNLKSICASVAFPAWVHGRDPSRRIVCVSYAQGLATELHNMGRSLVQSRWYRELFPGTTLAGKNTDEEYKTSRNGERFATSVGGVLTGRGGNIIIIDDPLSAQEATSEAARNRVSQWFGGSLRSRLESQTESAIILVMQRLHMDDLAGQLLENGGWLHLNLPAIAETDEQIEIGLGRWHRRRIGDLLHREREPQAVLDDMKKEMGSAAFSAQYQQAPVPVEGGMIKLAWFGRYSAPPAPDHTDQIVQSWDTAYKAEQHNDYSVCTTWRAREGAYYLLDVHRERMEYPMLKKRVRELAEYYRADTVLIEDKGSGTALIQELAHVGRWPVIGIEPQADKLTRASVHTAIIEGGQVFLPKEAPWLGDFEAEIAAFPNGRNDDQIDSISQFLAWVRDGELNCPRIRELG